MVKDENGVVIGKEYGTEFKKMCKKYGAASDLAKTYTAFLDALQVVSFDELLNDLTEYMEFEGNETPLQYWLIGERIDNE